MEDMQVTLDYNAPCETERGVMRRRLGWKLRIKVISSVTRNVSTYVARELFSL